MQKIVAPGVPLNLPGEGQVRAGLALDGDLDGRGASGLRQHMNQPVGLALQRPWLHAGSVQVHRHDAGPAQAPDLFAGQLPRV